jgi:galactose-1-phosphate uridylyltransferase
VSIFPKRHLPSFGHTPAADARAVAELLQGVLRSMRKRVGDPDLNFFIHGAPFDYKKYPYHHWHVEVIPVNVVSPPGGFEVSTEVIINVVDPDRAAKILRRNA